MSEGLKPCYFCGELEEIRIHENTTSPVMNRPPYVISCDITHWCKHDGLPRLSIKVTGRDKQEVIAAWNNRADLATYNPETHFLIAKDEVPRGLGEAVDRMLRDNQIHRHDEEKFELIAELVATKMGDE